ncbi:hypothetical protein ABIA30_003672 [Mycobacterium sp. MAA66]|uniref:hypothetical protein n=1 Tax=Mycobacterium sp. MAA66 TaxID=3156297 RepID=UPI00351915F3
MRLSRDRRLVYAATGLGVGVWSAIIFYGAIALIPVEHYLVSYYIADYRFGFIRRGLAGELVGPVDGPSFFVRAGAMRWTSTAAYLLSLASVGLMLLRNGCSERRIMLVLLLPTLSFGVPFAAFSARPDLFGATAVVLLALSVAARPGWALPCSAAYSVVIAGLAFVHEAIPVEFALGAILAIYLLAEGLSPRRRRWCAAVAVVPGLAAQTVISMFGRHDVGARLCAIAPHRVVPMMTNFREFRQQLRTGHSPTRDYHTWACRWYLTDYDKSLADAVRHVAHKGVAGLSVSLVLGLVGLAGCIAAVQYLSGVRFTDFLSGLRDQWAWAAFGLALTIPLFVTAFDWTRWLLVIAFNTVVVYLLYLRNRPELDEPPPRRTVSAFVMITAAFAVLPLGLIPGGATG